MCGIEAHICVLQTALDLLELGCKVHVVCDAVSSQRPYDRTVAFERMQREGAVMTTTESVLFELMGTAQHESFKSISTMLKVHNELITTTCPVNFNA